MFSWIQACVALLNPFLRTGTQKFPSDTLQNGTFRFVDVAKNVSVGHIWPSPFRPTHDSRVRNPPCRPLPGRAMSKRRGHLANLASLFAGSDSDDDSDYADDATIASNETGGDSLFNLLLLASKDDLDIYGQGTGRDEDESDDASETTSARAARRAGDSPRNDRDDRRQRVLRSTAGVAASGHARSHSTRNNPSGDVVDGLGGSAESSTSPAIPSQQDGTAANERPSKRSRAIHPDREGGGARDAAAPPESTTMAAGDDGPQLGGADLLRWPGALCQKGDRKRPTSYTTKVRSSSYLLILKRPASRDLCRGIPARPCPEQEHTRKVQRGNQQRDGYCNEYPSRPRGIQQIRTAQEQHRVVPQSHEGAQALPSAPVDCQCRRH